MRSTVSISVMVFLVVVLGGLGINWYFQASQAKHALEQAITNINSFQKDGGHPLLEYQAIETSGFPDRVVLSIVKPHFSGRIDQLLAQAQTNRQQELPEWFIDTALDGAITVSVNALSSHYTLAVSGNWQSVNTVGEKTISMSSQSDGDMVCTLDMAGGGGLLGMLWSFQNFSRDTLFRDIRLLDCSTQSYSVINPQTQEKLISSGGNRFYITSKQDKRQEHFRAYFKLTDMETTEAGNKIVQDYMKALFPSAAPVMTVTGKQNGEIDFTFNGPESWEGNVKDVPVDMYLSKFSLSNPYYTADAIFHLTDTPSGETRSTSATFKAESSFSPHYDELMQQTVKNMLAQCATANTPECLQLRTALPNATPDDLYALFSPAVPKFSTLGKMTQSLDAVYKGSSDFHAGDLNLSVLEISTGAYGISAKGSAHTAANAMIPAANITLVCTHCMQLVDDVAGYAMKVQKIAAAMNPGHPGEQIEPAQVEGFKKFITLIAASASSSEPNTFTYTIVSDNAGISISGKPVAEVMHLFSDYCAKPKH